MTDTSEGKMMEEAEKIREENIRVKVNSLILDLMDEYGSDEITFEQFVAASNEIRTIVLRLIAEK